jgi:hypothetical protein
MIEEPRLSDTEWVMVIELLERERNELPAEIHHTRSSTIRMELQNRLEMVCALLGRVRLP